MSALSMGGTGTRLGLSFVGVLGGTGGGGAWPWSELSLVLASLVECLKGDLLTYSCEWRPWKPLDWRRLYPKGCPFSFSHWPAKDSGRGRFSPLTFLVPAERGLTEDGTGMELRKGDLETSPPLLRRLYVFDCRRESWEACICNHNSSTGFLAVMARPTPTFDEVGCFGSGSASPGGGLNPSRLAMRSGVIPGDVRPLTCPGESRRGRAILCEC
jgi:hypothetical protein